MRITIAGLVGALSLGNNLGSGDGDLGWVRVETREGLLEQSMLGRAVSGRDGVSPLGDLELRLRKETAVDLWIAWNCLQVGSTEDACA